MQKATMIYLCRKASKDPTPRVTADPMTVYHGQATGCSPKSALTASDGLKRIVHPSVALYQTLKITQAMKTMVTRNATMASG